MIETKLEIFTTLNEAKEWIKEMEDKGYYVKQISNSETSIAIIVQKDYLKDLKAELKIIELKNKISTQIEHLTMPPAFETEENKQEIKKLKKLLEIIDKKGIKND